MTSIITTRIQTRMSDFDVLGHINNVSYVNFLEVARVTAFSQVMNVDLSRYTGLTVKTEIEYLRPANFGTEIAVTMGVSSVGEKSVDLALEVVDAGDQSKVFARARIVQVTVDLKTGKSCQHTAEMREQMEALMNGEADFADAA